MSSIYLNEKEAKEKIYLLKQNRANLKAEIARCRANGELHDDNEYLVEYFSQMIALYKAGTGELKNILSKLQETIQNPPGLIFFLPRSLTPLLFLSAKPSEAKKEQRKTLFTFAPPMSRIVTTQLLSPDENPTINRRLVR